MENPNLGYLCGRLLCFDENGQGDTTSEETWLQIEVVDHGGGFVEIAFDDRNERCYVSFRVSDLLRAVKEQAKAQGHGPSFLERQARFLQSGKRGDGT